MSESLVALAPGIHNRLRFEQKADFSFARKTHICPLLMSEVSDAARSYPVVFAAGNGVIVPQALFSIKPGINPFVAEDGSWQGGYLPLHLRRYPFFLGRDKKVDQAFLFFEEGAPQLGAKGKLLYNKRGDKYVASPLLKEIKASLISFDRDYQTTRAICGLLQNTGVLKEGKFTMKLEGKKQMIRGFSTVDWSQVVKLDDAVLANWVKIGLIQLINTHLTSIKNRFGTAIS